MRMSDLTVELKGSFRDQGRQHGEALAPIIGEILQETLDRSSWDETKLEGLLAAVQRNLADQAPWVLEEMRGIAESSRLPYEDIVAYNAIADVWAVHRFCSATAWADGRGGPILGKTNDIGQNRAKYHHPFRRRSGEGLPAVWATWPGTVWANCFINEPGLAFGGASLTMDARNEAGIPSNCMLRVLMDLCGSIEDVVRTCDRVPVMHHPAHNCLTEAGGDVAVIEMTPRGTYLCQPPGQRYVRATNHFCAGGPFEGQDSGEARLVENSRRRFRNLQRLAEELPHTVEAMQQLLRDHAPEGQICQHGNDDMWSSAAYVALARERCLFIARGQPCEAEFTEVVL